MSEAVRILGIDPGSRITGFGIIDARGPDATLVASGCIRLARQPLNERLHDIFTGIRALMAEHAPHEVAVERVFMHRNADSALKLGQARAAAICAAFADSGPDGLHEYAPREIKLAVVGSGSADKAQVQHMVAVLLGVRGAMQEDAADALAVALCHAHARRTRSMLAGSQVRA